MKSTRLMGPQRHLLNKWVEGQATQEEKPLNGKTFAEIASAATTELGFVVTSAHIRSARDFTGAGWKGRHPGDGHKYVTQAQLRQLLSGMEALAVRIGLRFSPEFSDSVLRVQKNGGEKAMMGIIDMFTPESIRTGTEGPSEF